MKGREKKGNRSFAFLFNKCVAITICVIAALLVVMSVVVAVCSFMRISDFDVEGAHLYEDEEIIAASGINPDEKLYSVNRKKAKESIMRQCPYVSSVDIDAVFPNTLRINVECYTPVWYVEIEGDFYSLDADFRVLEETESEQKYIDWKVTKLVVPNIKAAVVGSTLTFGDTDVERDAAYAFIDLIKTTPFHSRLSLVDVENRFDINIGIDGVIDVYLGGSSGMQEKLRAVEKALLSPKLENCVSASIHASDPSAVYIDATYDYSAENDNETTENEPLFP